ncbi:MAG: LytR family transcriptional regulator [Candidatus Moranbacteria bacterium]|nr:LytR family transcriptional regulator [Candidatus Moranbacteria bacterium]
MAYYSLENNENKDKEDLFGDDGKAGKKRKLKKILAATALVIIALGGLFYYKTASIFNKISTRGDGLFSGLFKSEDDLKGVSEGRTNLLLLGMRGSNMPGGSMLADTIMIVSIKPNENKVAMVSIPRDLYVEIPGHGTRKINAANSLGEGAGRGKGMELMQQVVQNITGLPIHYVATANFQAMREIVNTLGGVVVHLDKPFSEGSQFVEGNECGGVFSLPAGDVKLNGDQALCYSRARYGSSDFDRARRQQDVLIAIKDKAFSLGTLTDFNKVNDIANTVGDNVRTTMAAWEMQKFFGLYQKLDNPGVIHKVIDNNPESGLLYSTTVDTPDGASYALLPKGGNFDKIKELCQNIFNEQAVQSIAPPQNGYAHVEEPKTPEDVKKLQKNSNANGNKNSNANANANKNSNGNSNKNSNSNSNSNKNKNSNKNSNKNDNKKKD